MVTISNDSIFISKDDPSFMTLRSDLTFFNSGVRKIYKKRKDGSTYSISQNYNEITKIYENYNNGIIIPRGLLEFIKPYIVNSEIKDNQIKSKFFSVDFTKDDIENCKNILNSGFDLRPEQIIAIRKIMLCKRCIIQSATGSGKTEIMSGFLKMMNFKFGEYPTSLIVEPTVTLVNGTIKRLEKYGIPVSNYRELRNIEIGKANVCHPKSLINDLNKNPQLLSKINIIIGDEVHHMRSILFRSPSLNSSNIDYSIGLSASAISLEHIGKKFLTEYNGDELNIIGSCGPLVMNLKSGDLIDKGNLAKPVIIALDNPADEPIPDNEIANWHRISKDCLQSDNRVNLVCESAKFFSDNNRKIMILVNTIEWSRKLLMKFKDIDPEFCINNVRASYGGERYEYIDRFGNFVDDNSDVLKDYSNNKYSVLIGTSHIYEGADVPNLDVLILAFGGKRERIVQQGIGRVLRKTKNGKFAYVIDFTDYKNIVLSKQFKIRAKMYKEIMNVPDKLFYKNVKLKDLPIIFKELEE